MSTVKYIFRFILIGFIFMMMRSPFAMTIVGFSSGIGFYHFYPQQAEEGVHFVQSKVAQLLPVQSPYYPENQYNEAASNQAREPSGASDDAFRRTIEGM